MRAGGPPNYTLPKALLREFFRSSASASGDGGEGRGPVTTRRA